MGNNLKKYDDFLIEKVISLKKFKKLIHVNNNNNMNQSIDPWGEEDWNDDILPSKNIKDYEIFFKLKKEFDGMPKNSKFYSYGGLVSGVTSTKGNKLQFNDEEWFEPMLKYND